MGTKSDLQRHTGTHPSPSDSSTQLRLSFLSFLANDHLSECGSKIQLVMIIKSSVPYNVQLRHLSQSFQSGVTGCPKISDFENKFCSVVSAHSGI